MPKVFVADANSRHALPVIRSLGQKGITVVAGEESRSAIGFYSKYCSDHVFYPSPQDDGPEFAAYMLELVQREHYEVLFLPGQISLKPIIDRQEEISRYTRIALPPRDIFMRGYDKGETLRIAIENGVPCPRTHFYQESDSFHDIIDQYGLPLIVKPRISCGSIGLKICRSLAQLAEACAYARSKAEFGGVLIQEYIPQGGELGVYTLFNYDSEPRGLAVHRRIRSYPVSGGPSTLRETVRDEIAEKAIESAFRLLGAMRWSGVAMVEFRVDPREGMPKLMEVNPRFWGSLQLSVLAGVDFPYMLYKLVMEGDVEPMLDYQQGVKCRWLLPGDILWYLASPNKLKHLSEFLAFGTPNDILSLQDPGPALAYARAALQYLLDGRIRNFKLRRQP